MLLSEYLENHTQVALAGKLGVSQGLIHQWVNEKTLVKPSRCVEIERVTHRQVMRWDLRPNDWWQIWPELIAHPDAPSVPAELQVATASKGFPLGIPSQPQAVRGVNHG